MKVQPRQQLLEVWRGMVGYSFSDTGWKWGGRQARNSVSDAEQLVCLMYPATVLPTFKLDQPDQTANDVLVALDFMGDSVEIPKRLIRVLAEYMDTYSSPGGSPTFGAGSYLEPQQADAELSEEQRNLAVVDSYSMSITLTLATLGFIKVFRGVLRRKQLRDEVDALEETTSRRLTGAMIGLLRSFAVRTFEPGSDAGQAMCRTANQTGEPTRRIVEELHRALVEIRAGLLDVTLGSGGADVLDNENLLFECGWSWGTIKGALEVKTDEQIDQPDGVSPSRPYLYFTVVALDGIADLFSERTRILGLLNPEQQNLARALQLRWDLTQRYWSTLASFGTGRWPLEDIPWRTTDGKESDYYSLLVTSATVEDLVRRRATDADLTRVGEVLDELAARGRITRRPLMDDPAVAMHVTGVRLNLDGAEELGPAADWPASDYAAVLLKRTLRVAGLARSTELRDRLLGLADEAWSHLQGRRLETVSMGTLWDQPGQVFPDVEIRHDLPSWYYTQRVVECLVAAAAFADDPPLRSARLLDTARDLLNEADHLFGRELLVGSQEAGPAIRANLRRIEGKLARARAALRERPGSAMALALDVLAELEDLTAARADADRTI
ncbi:MAG: hypothetical protein DLM59_14770 [Pseudonocardiales bacterium]|nr:MAG: hypothetical protein DLM59_14770 [Pseudonocardiales bacterium]